MNPKQKPNYIKAQIAKWGTQVASPEFSDAAPDVQQRAYTAARHWDAQLNRLNAIRARKGLGAV